MFPAFKNLSAALGVGAWFELLTINPSYPLCSWQPGVLATVHSCHAHTPLLTALPIRTPIFLKESQNHRMVGVGRDLCGSSSPTPLLKQAHLQAVASYFHCSRTQPRERNAFLCCSSCIGNAQRELMLTKSFPFPLFIAGPCALHMKIELSTQDGPKQLAWVPRGISSLSGGL